MGDLQEPPYIAHHTSLTAHGILIWTLCMAKQVCCSFLCNSYPFVTFLTCHMPFPSLPPGITIPFCYPSLQDCLQNSQLSATNTFRLAVFTCSSDWCHSLDHQHFCAFVICKAPCLTCQMKSGSP